MNGSFRRNFSFLVLSVAWLAQCAVAAPHRLFSSKEFAEELGRARQRVEEFVTVRQLAEQLGVRAWLLGGSAATFARYVHDALEHSEKQGPFRRDRYDFDFFNIYLLTQDLDIVIDGNTEQAQRLQRALEERFPYHISPLLTPAPKSIWEVRLLRSPIQGKVAILDDPQFFWQHSDSDSTGLIELTEPPPGESVLRDVRDWDNQEEHRFLWGVLNKTLLYYFSENHEKTLRAQNGKNPPIMSVVRYLGKKFQFDALTLKEDEEKLREIAAAFDPKRFSYLRKSSAYAHDRLRRLGAKLLFAAQNNEKAWELLRDWGLQEKLAALGNIHEKASLAYLFARPPLLSFPLGRGNGPTAKELGLSEVMTEITHHLAYDALRHAPLGPPNAFATARFSLPEGGARQRGLLAFPSAKAPGRGVPVRLSVAPEARLGSDFFIVEGNLYFVNRAALSTFQESFTLSPEIVLSLLNDSDMDAPLRELLSRFLKKSLSPELTQAWEARLQEKLDELLAHLPSDPSPGEFSYYSDNGARVWDWAESNATYLPRNFVAAALLRAAVQGEKSGKLTRRDLRRLVARALGLCEPDGDFTQWFLEQWEQSPALRHAVEHHRGTFTESNQSDSARVRKAFEVIEKALSHCAGRLEMVGS